MQSSFFLKFVTVITVISPCLASNRSFRVKEVREKDLTSIEPLKTAGGAIASIGSDIAACIGQLRPLECLARMIQKPWEEGDDPGISDLWARPALLSEPKEEHSGHRLNPFWTPPATITIAEWLTKFTKRSESFYDLFSISNMFTTSPSIPFSELSFELLAIFDVVGVKARMDSSLTKYIGISHAVLFSAKFPWSKGHRPKKHRIQLKRVDSIVTYLGSDWEYSEKKVLLDKKIGHDLQKIRPKAWSNLMDDIKEMKYHIKGRQGLLNGEDVQLIGEDQLWSTVKKMIDIEYPITFWKNTLDYWLYEKVVAIPNLFGHINGKLNHKPEIPQGMESPIEKVEITKSESNGFEMNLAFFAKRLYSNQLEIEEFKEFMDMVYNSKCSFNLETCEMGLLLMYSSLFYALPDQAKQSWVWGFLERSHLLKDKPEELKEGNEEKQDAIFNAHSINRVEAYRQVAKAFRRNPDPNLISLLALIDSGRIEVISNYQFIDTPLLNMEWIFDVKNGIRLRLVPDKFVDTPSLNMDWVFDVKNGIRLRLVPEQSSEESSGSSTKVNQSSNICVNAHARLDKATNKKTSKINQSSNVTSLPSENEIDGDDTVGDTLKGISMTAKRPKPDVDHYEVSILRQGSIHDASNKVRQSISSQDRTEGAWTNKDHITENDLHLQPGDVIFIRDMRSPIRQPLKDIARLCFPEDPFKNGELLDYVLSTTNTIAIRVCDRL